MDIEETKVDIETGKVDIGSVLAKKGQDFSAKTTIHIHRLFEKFGYDEIFGRSAVMALLELKASGASKLISNLVVRYARALENSMGSNVETLYKMMDGKAEALEFIAKRGFKKAQIPFKYLELKSDILIVGIIRGRKTIIPDGEDMIMIGDKVIVLATNQRLYDLSDILK